MHDGCSRRFDIGTVDMQRAGQEAYGNVNRCENQVANDHYALGSHYHLPPMSLARTAGSSSFMTPPPTHHER